MDFAASFLPTIFSTLENELDWLIVNNYFQVLAVSSFKSLAKLAKYHSNGVEMVIFVLKNCPAAVIHLKCISF